VTSSNELILALDDAATSTDDYVIRIVKGTYTGEFVYTSTNLSDLTIEGGYTFNSTPCDGRDPDPDPADTVLDGNNSNSVLAMVSTGINGPANFSANALTLQNGNALNGGGLYVKTNMGNVILSNSIIRQNIGGGIYTDTRGDVTLSENIISNNSHSSNGGGARLDGYLGAIRIINNNINGNQTTNGGGGISVYTSSQEVTISGNNISYNEAGQDLGGGIHIAAQGVLIYDNLISQNTGGGIYSLPWWTGYQYNITQLSGLFFGTF
jgi:hypothetical protein